MTNLISYRSGNANYRKWIMSASFIFFVSFPFVMWNGFLYSGSSSRAVTLVGVTIVTGVIFSVWLFKRNTVVSIPRSYIGFSLLIYLLALIISSLVGIDPHTSFWSVASRTSGIWYLIHLGFFLYLLLGSISDRVFHKRLILAIVISTALYSFLAFMGPEGIGWLFKGRVGEGFTIGNSSFAGMYLFGAFILALYYLFQAELKKWWMYLLPVILTINPFILNPAIWSGNFSGGVIGEARSSAYVFVSALVAIFVLWLVSRIKTAKARSVAAYSLFSISIVVIMLCVYSLFSHNGYLRQAYLSQATAARPLIWDTSERVIAERPFLGWGPETFERVFEINYDNRLLQDEYGNEAWFDRAHNVFIDQLVDGGFIGLTSYLAIYIVTVLILMRVALRATDRSDRIFASLLIVYFTLHLAELQTAFDTTISYPIIVFMAASAIVLECRGRAASAEDSDVYRLNISSRYILAIITVVFLGWSFGYGLIPFVRAQIANGSIRTAKDSTIRMSLYPILFSSEVDQHSFLWRTLIDFQRAIDKNPSIIKDPKIFEDIKRELLYFEDKYQEYLSINPDHFRAHLGLANILIYQKLFGIDKLGQAQEVLDDAILLVPKAPQSYWMKAVAYVYMAKFDDAFKYAKTAYDLNPKIYQSEEVLKYIEKSSKSYPKIELFMFKQL